MIENGIKPGSSEQERREEARIKVVSGIGALLMATDPQKARELLGGLTTPRIARRDSKQTNQTYRDIVSWLAEEAGLGVREEEQID